MNKLSRRVVTIFVAAALNIPAAAMASELKASDPAPQRNVPQDVPGPCEDPLAMPDWCHGIPPNGPLPPALHFTLRELKPVIY